MDRLRTLARASTSAALSRSSLFFPSSSETAAAGDPVDKAASGPRDVGVDIGEAADAAALGASAA